MYTFESISHGSLFRYIFEHEENRQQAMEVFQALTGLGYDPAKLRVYGEGPQTMFIYDRECYCRVYDQVMPFRSTMTTESPSHLLEAGFEHLADIPANGRRYFLTESLEETKRRKKEAGFTVIGLKDAASFAPSCTPWQEYTAFVRRVYTGGMPGVTEIYDAIYACMPANGSLWRFMRRHADEIVRIIMHAHAVGASWKQGHSEAMGKGFAEGVFGICALLKVSRETTLKFFQESTGTSAAKADLLYRYTGQHGRPEEFHTYIGKDSGLLFARVFADEENHACASQLYRQLGGNGEPGSVSADQGFLAFTSKDGRRMAVHDFDGIMGCGLMSSVRMAGVFHRYIQKTGIPYERALALFHRPYSSWLIRCDSEGNELKDPLLHTVCTDTFPNGPLHDHALFCEELQENLKRFDDPQEIVREALAELPENSLLGQYLAARIQDITETAFLEIDMALTERKAGSIASRVSVGCGALNVMKLLHLGDEEVAGLLTFMGYDEAELYHMKGLLESMLPAYRRHDLVTY